MLTVPYADLGQPPVGSSATLESARLIGVTQINAFTYAFVIAKTTDGKTKLYAKTCFNGIWLAWADLGAPAGGINFNGSRQGTVVSAGNSIWVFVCGDDGKFYCDLWNGSAWTWVPMGTPRSDLKVTAVDNVNQAPFTVTVMTDNRIWMATWSGVMWVWKELDGPYIFYRTSSVLSINPSSSFMAMFDIDPFLHLICAASMNAGIATTGIVHIGGLDAFYYISGLNTDGTAANTMISGIKQKIVSDGYQYDLRNIPEFKSGAICWIGTKNYTGGEGREADANFNFNPSDPAGKSVGYWCTSEGNDTKKHASFSKASNY